MQRLVPLWSLILVGVVSVIAASIGAAVLFGSQSPKDTGSRDAVEELAAVKSHLDAGEMQSAYDALLAAMRIAPGNEKVFETSLDFVRKAAKETNDEAILLAEDIHQRAGNLIPFLPLARLKQARASHTQVGDELFSGKKASDPVDPLTEAESLLNSASRADLPISARARLLHEVDAELGSQARHAVSMTMQPQAEKSFWNRWREVKDRYEDAQKNFLIAVYLDDCKPRMQKWISKVEEFYKRQANVTVEEIHDANEQIFALIDEGQRIGRDLAPFLEGGVEAAVKDNRESGPDVHLNRLTRLREWNYNRWALDRLEKVKKSNASVLERLKSIAVIDENRLAPFTAQRFNEVWGELFEKCSENDKVEATKLRILREFEP